MYFISSKITHVPLSDTIQPGTVWSDLQIRAPITIPAAKQPPPSRQDHDVHPALAAAPKPPPSIRNMRACVSGSPVLPPGAEAFVERTCPFALWKFIWNSARTFTMLNGHRLFALNILLLSLTSHAKADEHPSNVYLFFIIDNFLPFVRVSGCLLS